MCFTMGACLVIGILFLNILGTHAENERSGPSFPFTFVAAIIERGTSNVVATGAVISPHWVLTSAHLFPDDSTGVDASKYTIVAGGPVSNYNPSFALTYPTYTWGLYTAEDLALFYVEARITAVPVLLAEGRFPWNKVECFFIYWQQKSLMFFKNEITVLHNCLTEKHFLPIGMLEFYSDDILCGSGYSGPDCAGETGGLQYCENMLVGLLIRRTWCENKTANFTDVGAFSNWLHNRVGDALFIRLVASDTSPLPPAPSIHLAVFLLLLTLSNRH